MNKRHNYSLRIHLGCGVKKLPGYVNIDILEEVQPDLVCDLGKERLPFKDDSIDYVYSSHFLEHLSNDETKHLLEELYRICKNDSRIDFVVPHYLNPIAYQLGHRQRISERFFGEYDKLFSIDYFVSLQKYRPKNKWHFPFLMIIPCNIYFTLTVKKAKEKKL